MSHGYKCSYIGMAVLDEVLSCEWVRRCFASSFSQLALLYLVATFLFFFLQFYWEYGWLTTLWYTFYFDLSENASEWKNFPLAEKGLIPLLVGPLHHLHVQGRLRCRIGWSRGLPPVSTRQQQSLLTIKEYCLWVLQISIDYKYLLDIYSEQNTHVGHQLRRKLNK